MLAYHLISATNAGRELMFQRTHRTSGLAEMRFDRPKENPPEPYDTPEAPDSSFRKPGPVAGPFKRTSAMAVR